MIRCSMGWIINLIAGMRFSAGVDSITEEVREQVIEYNGITDSQGSQYVNSWVKAVESQENLVESLNFSISASARYRLASGDAKLFMVQDEK